MTGRLVMPGVALAVALALDGCVLQRGEPAASGDFVDIPGIGATRMDVPRPSGIASAACDDDPLPPASDATIAERVAELRTIGLFANRSDLTDTALAAEVGSAITDSWGPATELPSGMADLAVAKQDRARVWWRDLEADVVDGNDVYVQTLAEWGEISMGAFEPTEIAESWEGADGPVAVEFVLDGTPQTLSPAYFGDWIDPGILVPINESMAESGRRFELYKAFDQTALVMALTDAERVALEARGWCFE